MCHNLSLYIANPIFYIVIYNPFAATGKQKKMRAHEAMEFLGQQEEEEELAVRLEPTPAKSKGAYKLH